MLKFTSQKFLISLFEPGSWPPNWLDGIANTTKPLCSYVSHNFCKFEYCLVNPHLLATFTNKIVLFEYLDKSIVLPSISLMLKSKNIPHVKEIYQTIIDNSRNKIFYIDLDIEDSFESRFDLVILHSFVIFQYFIELGNKKNKLSNPYLNWN